MVRVAHRQDAPRDANRAQPLRRIDGLDGLRAIAVSAVVFYHLGWDVIPGGFLGVDLFFVISGFLITTLLLAEVERAGRIEFRSFYIRRARRLLPALFLVLAVTLVLAATVARDVAQQTVRDTPAALLYVSNWWAITQQQSYFELVGRGNMLAHLWSLAVEEQFYLLWPAIVGLICIVAMRRRVSRRALVFHVAALGAVLSTLWMGFLSATRGYPIDADPTRAYFGTDTHAMSVMAGAALASFWKVSSLRKDLAAGARILLVVVGIGLLAPAAWFIFNVSEYTPWIYQGGFLLIAIVFALVVAAVTHPGSPLGRLLDVAPMRWIGERSYGIYLWHWPIFVVTRPGIDIPWEGVWVDLVRVALVLVVAGLSYRFVEVPIRHGAIGRWIAVRRDTQRQTGLVDAWLTPTARGVTLTAVAVVAAAVVSGLLVTAPSEASLAMAESGGQLTDVVDTESSAAPDVTPIAAPIASNAASSASPANSSSPTPSSSPSPTKASASKEPAAASASPTKTKTPVASAAAIGPLGSLSAGVSPADRPLPAGTALSTADISWFGDSVSLWSVDVLRKQLPGVKVDAGNNRSPGFIMDRVLAARSRGQLRRAVVMHLGDAGPVSEAYLDRTLSALGDRVRIVIINSTARFAFSKVGNVTIRQVVLRHPNVVVADWKTYSAGHSDWFKDGLHLTPKGKPIFAQFVRRAMLGR